MQIAGRRYDTHEAVLVQVRDGRVASSQPADAFDLPWIAPGFVDLQVNGYAGVGFNEEALDAEQMQAVSLELMRFGVTAYLPTCTTDSFERLVRSLSVIAQSMEELPAVGRLAGGIHLEGPYISLEDGPRGAHPRQHVRPPSWEEFQRLQDAARGRIALVTLSAEYEESPSFIQRATAHGVVAAIGHTSATTQQIQAAVAAGARLSTHLGNGAHPLIRRHPNYIWDQLADDELMASLIVDGHHLPPAVVKAMVRAKTPQRCLLVSDMTNLAGLPPGRYSTSLGEVEMLDDGRLVVAGQREILAGASQPITVNIAKTMQFAGVDLKTAVDMASLHPRRLMGWDTAEFLEIGSPANLVTFRLADDALQVEQVVHGDVNALVTSQRW